MKRNLLLITVLAVVLCVLSACGGAKNPETQPTVQTEAAETTLPTETAPQETTPEHKEKMDMMSNAAVDDTVPAETGVTESTQPQEGSKPVETKPAKPSNSAPVVSGNEDQLPMA